MESLECRKRSWCHHVRLQLSIAPMKNTKCFTPCNHVGSRPTETFICYANQYGRMTSSTLRDSDSAVAYGVGALLIFLLCFTAFLIMVTPVINDLNGFANEQIIDGEMSEQRKDAHGFINLVWKAAPVFFVLAGLAWAIVRALEARGDAV